MKKITKILFSSVLMVGMLTISSCKKPYKKYNNMEVVENTFTGKVIITSTGKDPAGDYVPNSGSASGTYSFAWENSSKKASANFGVTGGTVQMIIKDAKGDEVLNATRTSGGSGPDTFSGVSQEGKKGKWLITLIISLNSGGDGSFSVHPGS